ncbi:glycosyltransferase [Pedobacter sp. GR22-10]|uniref:glycosyltransferase n=1 Tax=Pedobacter sp. GR22-10 TaxID=2994472 RepID=UPI002247FDEE|nr:glycosyltransferase [Pedobacter sp. GR22-10]MCX2432371.1 glycosyltransferase [Pedobacter sp. GR22-10]
MQTIIISGVNLTEGGILSILQDLLKALKSIYIRNEMRIIVLVNSKQLVPEYLNDFEIYEYPHIKSSWLKRLRFEYIESMNISKKFNPDLWISLHDITPNVKCAYQVVYCHNPSPFYKLPIKDIGLDFTFSLFTKLYKYLYAINIRKNKFVIIQQNWLRKEFKRRYNVESIVAHPTNNVIDVYDKEMVIKDSFMFFYPSFPRVFKNFETLLASAVELNKRKNNFVIVITISGKENKYSQKLFEKYSKYPFVKFIGLQKREEVFNLYRKADCLVFPSKLETWGLPLSEFKPYNKPIIASNLPYAKETIGDYNKVKFYNPDDPLELANYMELLIDNNLSFDENKVVQPEAPFFLNWNDLVKFLIESSKN